MAKKKTVWKWIGAIAFALLAMISVVQNIKLLIDSIAMLPERFLLVNFISIAINGVVIVGYLLLGVACLLRKGRVLAMIGASVLILMTLTGIVESWVVQGINWVDLGTGAISQSSDFFAIIAPKMIISSLGSGMSQLIRLAISIFLLLALILHKKDNKILCFTPAALHVVAKIWYLCYTILMQLLYFPLSFSSILSIVLDSNWLSLLLNVVAFAAICYVMTGKKEIPAENA